MKKVLVDLTHYGEYNGFGEVDMALADLMSKAKTEGMRLTFLVRKKYIGAFGDGVDYLAYRDIYKFLPILLPKFDLWHATDQQPRIFPRKGRGKILLTIHDLNYRVEGNPRRVKKYDGKIMPKIEAADRLTYITQFTKEYVEKSLNVKGKESEVVYQGMKDATEMPRVKPSFIRTGREFVFTVGRINTTKNQECLLDAAKEMTDMDFFICGVGKADLAEKMKRRIEEEKIGNIWLTGGITNEERCWMYANCAAFVFPSLMEGFGLPPLEAMCFERPVVCSDRTSLEEVCDGHATILRKFDGKTIAEAIRTAIENGKAHPEALKEAREHAVSFNFEKTVGRYLEIYREMMGLQ